MTGTPVRLRLRNRSSTKILVKVKGNVGPNPAPMEKQVNLPPDATAEYADWPPDTATNNIWVRTWYGTGLRDFKTTIISDIDGPNGVDLVEVTLENDDCDVKMEIWYVDSNGQPQNDTDLA